MDKTERWSPAQAREYFNTGKFPILAPDLEKKLEREQNREPRKARVKSVRTTEHDEQAALFEWAEIKAGTWPELRLMYAIPNGGHRSKAVAGKLKAEGVKAGVPDICLPVARGGYHGLYVEMKIHPNRPSGDQLLWIQCLNAQGYRVDVCYGCEAAMETIMDYLQG